MTLRAPHEQALLDSQDITLIRRVLADCARLLESARHNASPQLSGLLGDATRAATERGLSPDGLAYYISLAIDHLDFAPPPGNRR